jgi:hypothetical protein
MSEHPSVADWITATATAITAIGATIGGFVAWLAFRRDSRNQLPIIEADFQFEEPYWSKFTYSQPLTGNDYGYISENKTTKRISNC